jgi:hypothetical protein
MNSGTTIHPLLTSLTRNTDFETSPFEVRAWPRDDWETGDYVLGKVVSAGHTARLELTTGREMSLVAGDTVIGALGIRAATLEAVGDWREIGQDLLMDAMTAAGLFGRITSKSHFIGDLARLQYRGHVTRAGTKMNMRNFVQKVSPTVEFNCPIVLIIGTSMSSGKTMSGRVIVRMLARQGLRVVGAKLTGAGRYRDVLALKDAGAAAVFDFVDSGLPSTVCSVPVYQESLETLIGLIAAERPDVIVAEAGASPLEPYNGKIAMQRILPHVRCTVLCASDPYAVVGVTQGFGFQPDLVSGVATSTSAGCRVVEELTGLRALNLQDSTSASDLEQLLQTQIGF